ncbi:MAG: OmpA family protein [Campylobacterota bacterium]|nr:OmpA family protein [Campylobacterota bacterium]
MRIFILFISLFGLLYSQTENSYSIVIGGTFEDSLYDITQDHDGQISAVGYSQNFKTTNTEPETYTDAFEYLSSLNSARGEQIRLVRLDSQANITLDRSMNFKAFNRASSLIKTPQNGYYIGGDTQEGQLLVIRMDSHGTIKFSQQFGTKNFDRMHKLVLLRDGGVLAVGSSITSRDFSDALYEQGLGLNDIYLTRFSKEGRRLWSKKYGTIYDDRGIDATEAYDGTILVAATTDIGKDRGITLMRITENGDKIWLKQYTKSGVFNVYDLITLRDDHFLASLSYKDPLKGEQIRLLKFDLQQNLLAEHNISTAKSSALYSIKEQSDGKIIGVGYTTDKRHINTDAFAISFDPLLKPIWQYNYGNTNRNLFRSVTILRDGSYVAAGETVAPHSEVTNMWIVKLGDDGSIISLRQSARSLYDNLYDTFSNEIAEGKITITRDLTITLVHPALLFKTGIYELTAEQKTFLNQFAPKLLKTLSAYKPNINALRINGHTSSEWRGADFTHRYLNNAKLSTQRAYSVLSDIFTQTGTKKHQQWLSDILTNEGYAFSKLIKKPDEDAVLSRRVTFKIEVKQVDQKKR